MNKWISSVVLCVSFMGTVLACVFVIRTPAPAQTVSATVPTTSSTASIAIPASDATPTLNDYWLDKVNELRRQKNLSQLVVDGRLEATAQAWADWMGTHQALTHDRPDGRNMHQWIADYNLPFTKRNTPGGWSTNYFVENIGRAYADETLPSEHAALDQVFDSMMSEGDEGIHVRSMTLPDWNSYGAGFYFEPVSPGRVRIYMAFHYASLATNEAP